MGLDWKPMNKPLPGKEKEYEALFQKLTGQQEDKASLLKKLFGKKEDREKLLQTFLSISTTGYETLLAPRVGIDDQATEWAKRKYEFRTEKDQSLPDFLKSNQGYYAVDLVPVNDGIPVYIALHYEAHIFRAQFLNMCEDIIGPAMLEEAYKSQLAPGTINFGDRLMSLADAYAKKHQLEYLKDQRLPPDGDEKLPESKVHILFSAAKWLLWWGRNGHGYEADF